MWQIIYDDNAKKQLSKLDRKAQADILRYIRERSPRKKTRAVSAKHYIQI